MALFKPMYGNSTNLPTELHAGYAYFTTDDGHFYIDYEDKEDNNTLKRKMVNDILTVTQVGVDASGRPTTSHSTYEIYQAMKNGI